MLALLGVGIPQGKARVIERRRLPDGVGEQRDARRGIGGREAADEELERRHRGRAATAAALGAAIPGTMRRPTARGDREQVAARTALDDLVGHEPVSTRIVRARSTSSPAVASTPPTATTVAPTTLASRITVAWLRSGTSGTRSRSIACRRSSRRMADTPRRAVLA
jgi:hypothetical protein